MNNIKFYREQAEMSQEAVAASVGVSQQCVSHWEAGIHQPHLKLLPKLAKLFGCTIDDLIRTEEEG